MSTLSLLVAIPFITSLLAFIFLSFLSGKTAKSFAFILSLLPLALLIYGQNEWLGKEINSPWLASLHINFFLSMDSLSLTFLYLIAIIIPISILAVNPTSLSFSNLFFGLVLLLQGLLTLFFLARDLALFTIFWEAMLIPLYFIIHIWGGPKSHEASIKFLVYMIAGSALMVAAVLALFFASATENNPGTFNIDLLQKVASTTPYAPWILAIFLLAFAVKTPLFPFHAWLPDTYCQASTPGTILLAGILSKAGIYGILRIGIGLFPSLLMEWSHFLLGFAIAGVFYGGLAAWAQKDFKRLIAYSSFSHVNFILVGLFVMNPLAETGALLQSINHALTITALFLVAGWLEERLHSTIISTQGGLASHFPLLCWLTLFFVLASVALPGTNNFVGELLIFLGLFARNAWLTAFFSLSIVLSAIYMLRWMQKSYFETPSPLSYPAKDIKIPQLLIALPLVLLILWIGIYPTPVINLVTPAVEKLELHK